MLTIGSRGSKLALWQAAWVKTRLEESGHETRIEVITTSGDRFQHGPLKEIGSKGLFTKEIEDALLDGRVDVAVHSLKDMPAALPDGLKIAASPARENAHDALVGRKLADLPRGGRVGTGSLRRIAQLRAARPDLDVQPMRGNVDTRLRKLDEGGYDAIVLAAAGLNRLGWENRIAELMPFELMCPAVGQGALAIQTRDDSGPAAAACALLDHAGTRAAITAERAMLGRLGGGCQVPVGGHAWLRSGRLHMIAVVATPDGSRLLREELDGSPDEPASLGNRIADRLLSAGAAGILEAVYGHPA